MPAATRKNGRLADNILLFCRTLRAAGIPITPAQVLEALRAVRCVGLPRRDDVYVALRAVLVRSPAEFALFEQAFEVYFRNPGLNDEPIALMLTKAANENELSADVATPSVRQLAEALADDNENVACNVSRPDCAGAYSAQEQLRNRNFESMSLDEQHEARQLLLDDIRFLHPLTARRFQACTRGNRFDLRQSMRMMVRNDGELLRLARRRRRVRPPAVVLICDVSGSMSQHSRMFLHFAHTLTSRAPAVHSFVFGTRLTNVSRRLTQRNADAALQQIGNDVCDWDGGTRIAGCLREFNVAWARRLLAQNAVVVLMSDGLERDPDTDLASQTARLQRSCRQLIWLNPLLSFRDFSPKAYGIRTMLPHVDRFLPAHNVASLSALAKVLSSQPFSSPRRFAREAAA